MEKVKQFVQRIKSVKPSLFAAIPVMCLGFFASLPFRLFHRNVWLICERKNEARDNGYWFYKYLRENHPEIEAVYAINKQSPDYKKVASLGKVISFGSLTHWIYYFAAKRNVSSQKEGKPNAGLCFLLEVYLGARKNRAFLQHGIIQNELRWLHYDVAKINLFTSTAKKEYEYVKDHFGYPPGSVQLLGLCRFDNLLSPHEVKRQIVVMPTMRVWLRSVSSDTKKYEGHKSIKDAEYFVTWNAFLQNRELYKLLEDNRIELIFFPHAALQHHISFFSSSSPHIHIARAEEYDVQQLLMESAVLITDYSSIHFDFAYLRKPMLYYQFDYDTFRKGHYQEGYFSYKKDGFGAVVSTEKELLSQIKSMIENNLETEEVYKERAAAFFSFCDTDNCKRTYEAVRDMKKKRRGTAKKED